MLSPLIISHTPFPGPQHDHRTPRLGLPVSLSICMILERLPDPVSQPTHTRSFRRWRPFLRSNGSLRTCLLFGSIVVTSLIIYATFLSPGDTLWRRPTDWYDPPQRGSFPSNPKYASSPTLPHAPDAPTNVSRPWTSTSSDVLTLEQIRDIVAPTRGIFTRDYSLHLGWNNVRV